MSINIDVCNKHKLTIQIVKPKSDNTEMISNQQHLTDVDQAFEGVNLFCQKFNETFEPNILVDGSTIKACSEAELPVKISFSRNLGRDGENKLLGLLYQTTILTIIQVFKTVFKYTSDPQTLSELKVLIEGPPQAGKTGVFNACLLMLCVMIYVLSKGKIKPIPILTVPAYGSIHQQTIEELKAAKQLYGELVFEKDEFSCSIDTYFSFLENSDAFANICLENKSRSPRLIEQIVVKRTKKGEFDSKALLEAALKEGFTNGLVFTDEGHFGANVGGIQDQICQVEEIKLEDKINYKIAEIVISATADEIHGDKVKEGWDIIQMHIDQGYNGPDQINRIKVPTLNCQGPSSNSRVESYSEFIDKHGLHKIPMIELAFSNIKEFAKKFECSDEDERIIEDRWNSYQRKFIENLVDTIRLNFNWDSGQKGIFFRFHSNYSCEKILEKILVQLTEEEKNLIEPIEFYGRNLSPIKTLCKPVFLQKKYALILATANARLSCPFPGSIHCFVDLTESTTTAAALIQGSYGRSCGYNKLIEGIPPLLLISDDFKKQYDYIKANGFAWAAHNKRPGIRTRKNSTNFLEQWNYPFYPLLHPSTFYISEMINKIWIKCRRPFRSNPKNNNSKLFNCYLKELIDNIFLEELPSTLIPKINGKFLKWGETDQSNSERHRGSKMEVTLPGDTEEKGGFSFRWNPNLTESDLINTHDIKHRGALAGSGSLRNSRLWNNSDGEGKGIITPSIAPIFKNEICKDCKSPIRDSLWKQHAIYNAKRGFWPEEIQDSCCWNNSEIKIIAIQLRLSQPIISTSKNQFGMLSYYFSNFFFRRVIKIKKTF